MYKKILVPLALDQGIGVRALNVARQLRDVAGELIAVHVIEPVPGFTGYYVSPDNEDEIRAAAKAKLAERIGDQRDAEIVVLVGHPGRIIAEYAGEIEADCIVVGSHAPNLQDYLLGSTAARVVRHAPCSVHVLR